MTSVRDQMDQPTIQPLHGFSRPLSVETKTINNMDNRRNMDAKDGARASDNLSVPRRQARLPNIYAGAPESNLWFEQCFTVHAGHPKPNGQLNCVLLCMRDTGEQPVIWTVFYCARGAPFPRDQTVIWTLVKCACGTPETNRKVNCVLLCMRDTRV